MRSKSGFLSWFPHVLLLLTLLLGMGGCIKVVTGPQDGTTPGTTDVPINLKGASNVGSLHIELVYDSALLEATAVKPGTLARNVVIESNLATAGRAIIGIIDTAGINGDGSVVTVSFKVKGKDETSQLTLENVAAYDAQTLFDIALETSPGQFAVKNRSYIPPAVSFK